MGHTELDKALLVRDVPNMQPEYLGCRVQHVPLGEVVEGM